MSTSENAPIRGGEFGSPPEFAPCDYRFVLDAGIRSNDFGFRVVFDIRNNVMRGGSWYDYHEYARCAYRYRNPPPGYRYFDLGFRPVFIVD